MSPAKRLIAAVVAAVAFGLSLIHAGAQEKPEVVRLGYYAGPRPWVIGKAQGLFDKNMGTKAEWVQFGTGADALTALASGQIDISRLGSTPTVAAIARGLPIEIIAISGVIATSERLIAKEQIGSVVDLKDKSIAYPPGSTAHYSLMAALKVARVNVADVRLLSLKPAEMLAAWERGDIDAAYVWGPFSHQMEASGGRELLATQDLQKDGYYVWNNFVVRKEFAEAYPDTVVQFLRTFQQTVDLYKSDTDAMVKLVATELGIEEKAVADTMAGLSFPSLTEQLSSDYFGDGGPILQVMKDQAAFLVELGDLREREVPESFAAGVNTSYMRKAVETK